MARLHYYVHGRGRGHASRSRVVIAALRGAGHEVQAFAGASAHDMLRAEVPTAPVESIVPGMGVRMPLAIATRVGQALAAARRERAELVVSDGDLPGLLAASALRLPSVAIGHGLVFHCCERPDSLPLAPWQREARKAAMSTAGASRKIAVNFVPLPLRRGRLARPSLDLPAATERTTGGPVLCYFRDGAPRPLLRQLATLPGPVILFATTDPAVPGLRYEPPSRARFVDVLRAARGVVATAGSQLISECVALGTPMLATFDPSDDEQALNVAMLRHAGVGDGCPLPQLDGDRLERFFDADPPAPVTWDAPDVATTAVDEVHNLLRGGQ